MAKLTSLTSAASIVALRQKVVLRRYVADQLTSLSDLHVVAGISRSVARIRNLLVPRR